MCIEDRLLFIGLWSYVDDNGVGIDRHSDICADLFAHDLSVSPHDTLMRVQDGLKRLETLGVILRYTVESKRYLEITNWSKHQRINRPSPGRYPRSDTPGAQPNKPISEDSLNTHEPSPPGAGEQGSRGTGEQGITPSSEIASDPEREDVTALLDLLDHEIQANGNRPPKRNKSNHDAIRLLLDRDNHTPDQIAYVIRWSQQDDFWQANILSATKLREKFDQLVAKIRADHRRAERPSEKEQRNHDILTRFVSEEQDEITLEGITP